MRSLILDMLPIDAEGWDALVVKHAERWPIVGRTKASIKTKYAATKRIKSSTGNPNIPEYVKMTRRAHILIGKKANLGTGEEDFDMKQGFIKSEALKGSVPTKTGVPAGILAVVAEEPLIILAQEASSAEVSSPVGGATPGSSSSVWTPSIVVHSTPIPKKRSYQHKKSSVPDAAAFNEYIRSQQERDKESCEMWKEPIGAPKQVARDFLVGAAVAMMFNQWQQHDNAYRHPAHHGPPPQHSYASIPQPLVYVASMPWPPWCKQQHQEQEFHGEKKEVIIARIPLQALD